jgi:hypothetical protein
MTTRRYRPHYRGDYARRAAIVRAAANANPDIRCARCGELARAGDPWTAGHVNEGQVNGPLRPEHRSCNCAAGASYGNGRREPRSEQWY